MSDLGRDIRRYYETVVERVDPASPRHHAMRSGGQNAIKGVAVALVAVVIVLIVFGAVSLLFPGPATPIGPQTTTTGAVSTTVDGPPGTTIGPASLGPTLFVTADGEEIASIGEEGLDPAPARRSLASHVLGRLSDDPGFWPEGTNGPGALGLDPAGPMTGLTVHLSIETQAQEVVESVISEWQSEPETSIAIVVIDNETGHVVAAGPAADPIDTRFPPDRLLPAASLAQVYTTVAAMEAGIGLDTRWDASSPQTFSDPLSGREWTVANASGVSQEPVPLGDALVRAIDSVFAGVAMDIGPQPIIDTAGRLGVHLVGLGPLSPLGDSPATGPPLESVAIGAGQMTTLDAAAMFATLSREGRHTRPILIESIAGPGGETIYDAPAQETVTVDPSVVEAIRDPLADVPSERGTAPRAGLDVPQIGKTGTASGYETAWYAGSTIRYTAAVSVSRPASSGALQPLMDIEFGGQRYARVFGGSVPAPIWAELMSQLHRLP